MHIYDESIEQYGIAKIHGDLSTTGICSALIEKPRLADAPSTLGVVGRYILNSTIFDKLDKINIDNRGELQLTSAINSLIADENVLVYEFSGKRFDCGNKDGYRSAVDYFDSLSKNHPRIHQDLVTTYYG